MWSLMLRTRHEDEKTRFFDTSRLSGEYNAQAEKSRLPGVVTRVGASTNRSVGIVVCRTDEGLLLQMRKL